MNMATLSKILEEESQTVKNARTARKKLIQSLEQELKSRTVVSFFTSFSHPVMIDAQDVEVLEDVLHHTDLTKGLALIISSPGGDALAAERIIKACKSYSGTGDFWVIIPSKAKSAATIISLGASKIIAGPTSELGPIDPQLRTINPETKQPLNFSVFNILKSYDDLFEKATKREAGIDIRPYLQQLSYFDPKEIEEYRMQLELSGDLAIRALQAGMMQGKERDEIERSIEPFLSLAIAKTHGRPIYRDVALKCGLNVQEIEKTSDIWKLCQELYIRTTRLFTNSASNSGISIVKSIESKDVYFTTTISN